VQQRDAGLHDKRIRATKSTASDSAPVIPDYRIRDLELLHPERLRQCSSVRPDYRIRD
jgi:hypothetical protein